MCVNVDCYPRAVIHSISSWRTRFDSETLWRWLIGDKITWISYEYEWLTTCILIFEYMESLCCGRDLFNRYIQQHLLLHIEAYFSNKNVSPRTRAVLRAAKTVHQIWKPNHIYYHFKICPSQHDLNRQNHHSPRHQDKEGESYLSYEDDRLEMYPPA